MLGRTQTIQTLTCRHSSESQEPWDLAGITSAWLSLLKWGRAHVPATAPAQPHPSEREELPEVASRSPSDNADCCLLFRLASAQIIFKTWAAKFQALGPAKFTVPLYSH